MNVVELVKKTKLYDWFWLDEEAQPEFYKSEVEVLESFAAEIRRAALLEAAEVCETLQDCGPENGCCPTYWNEALEKAEAAIRELAK